MYENPIKMYMSEMQEQIEKQTEEELMVSVNQSIGFDVNKEELLKALQYDREQYTKGYSDCKIDMLVKIKQVREEMEIASYSEGVDDVLAILDKLIAESEEK